MNELKQSTCKRCGRKLRSPATIERGMGDVCWNKYVREKSYKHLFALNLEKGQDDEIKD